jgi:hypothetical protein
MVMLDLPTGCDDKRRSIEVGGRMKLRSRHIELRQGAATVGDLPFGSVVARIGRRRLMAAAALTGLGVSQAKAHHGWSGFDSTRPIYLEGRVTSVRWQNPHVELELDVPAALKRPDDLARRSLPAQQAAVDGTAMLEKAVVPPRPAGVWRIELAPLTRMQAWKVPEVKAGDRVAVVGFGYPDDRREVVMRAEFLFAGGRAYGLRSSPAG